MTAPSDSPSRVVFLLDVDNTLLDNDAVAADLKRFLTREVGAAPQERYWAIFEALRAELGYADYLGALQRYRIEHPHDTHLLAVSAYLVDYPFANRLYPGSLDVIEHLAAFGPPVILSDGDVVFQPRKVARSGLFEAVEGRVLIYIHKEQELDEVERRYPAAHYVLVDDKIRILSAVKKAWGARVTTVFPRQGHYAYAPDVASYPPADIAVERIGELVNYELPALLDAAHASKRAGRLIPAPPRARGGRAPRARRARSSSRPRSPSALPAWRRDARAPPRPRRESRPARSGNRGSPGTRPSH